MEEELTEEQLRERQERRRRRKEERLRHVRRMRILCCFFALAICVIAGSIAAAVRSRAAKKTDAKQIELASIEAERVKVASEAEAEKEEAAKKRLEDLPDVGAIYGIYVKERGWSHFFADNSYCMAPVGNSVTAIRATLHNQPEGMTGTITYQVNLSGSGWLDWQEDGSDGGRIDQDMPLEAVRMQLTGELGEYYDILYSVLQDEAWTDWVMNGEEAGASGVGLRMDGLRISVVKKQEGKTSYAGGIDPAKPMIALTYDDGPSSTETPKILEALKAAGGKATFFMVGKQVEKNSGIVKQMAEQGCEVGNHTYDHTLMTKVEPMALAEQLARTNQVVSDSSGISPVLMRPCGGARCDAGMDVVGAVSMPAVMWSIDTLDWKTRDTQNTIQTVLDQVQDGDIILMHDLYEATAAASQTLIPELVSRGYQLVTVSELASYRGGMLPGKAYSRFRPN
ncbi:MAG: polysaccharide deacetylase family protein [Lachnospiraceae bacterium]|nr:polysaccharide deacetylase family protein [Lachnospiraceae bacterium]